ncbi:NmrA family NAD(P)-binding protein [Nostoc sp.]|uniref:NmrA family NAD(P)-binding protein n=1 Tax=Nostoc sp. TaxID=1180 RepID=UPI002FFCFD8F
MSTPNINTDSTILAVGAAGPFAGLVVPELAKRGAKVRGLIRDRKQTDKVRNNGAAEVAIGDLTDRASIDAALKGVDSVFYIAPAFIPNEAEIGKSMVEAAKQAGVRRFVFSSVIEPVISVLKNHIAKSPVEEAIIESDMEYVILQPTLFFQNLAQSWSEVLKTGTYGEPWSEETRFSRVDYRDVAEVAAIALTEDRLLYGTYQLCAEGNLNRKEIVALMSEVLGRKIESVRPSPPASPAQNVEQQPSPMQIMFDWYDHHALVGNALTLRAILDREPRTLRDYFKELAAQPQAAE